MSEKYAVGEGKYRVLVYGPPDGSNANRWRLDWVQGNKRKGTTAKDKASAFMKADEVAGQLKRKYGERAGQSVEAMAAAYLDPEMRMRHWGENHDEDQKNNMKRFITFIGTTKKCKDLTTDDIHGFINSIDRPSSKEHLATAVKGLITWGHKKEWIITSPDVLLADLGYTISKGTKQDKLGMKKGAVIEYIDRSLLPTHKDVAEFGKQMAIVGKNYRWELMANLAAYSGIRLGEIMSLEPENFDTKAGTISITTQVLDVVGRKKLAPPKNNSVRTTIYPTKTPEGYPLAKMIDQRIKEVKAEGAKKIQDGTKSMLMFPDSEGGWLSQSPFSTNIRRPAQKAAGWKKGPEGKYIWKWHTFRHVFCTWLIFEEKKDVLAVSKAAGHKSVMTTLAMYVNTNDETMRLLREGL
jgi:integrase